MKNSIFVMFLFLVPLLVQSQYFEIRTIQSDLDYLYVQMRDTTSSGVVNPSAEIVDLIFEVRWLQSLGSDVDVEVICTDYWVSESLGYRGTEGNYYYRIFSDDPMLFNSTQNWLKDEWQTLVKLKVTSTSDDTGSFAPAPHSWVAQGLNLNVEGINYDVHVVDSVPDYPYPTIVYDYVWQGGDSPFSGFDENSWGNGLNWVGPCGTSMYGYAQPPTDTSNCAIPGGLTYYPTNFNNQTGDSIYHLRMQPGSRMEIPTGITLAVFKNVLVEIGADMDVKGGGNLELKNE